MTDERFIRTRVLIGEEKFSRLEKSHVLIFGAGGVGGYTTETLARVGVGSITVVDFDTVSVSNINRQIIADDGSVGKYKAELFCDRIHKINPYAKCKPILTFVTSENAADIIDGENPDFIVDAIDNVTAKIALIIAAKQRGVPIISSMGTGNKTDPSRLKISDISKTSVCPLCRVMRQKLKCAGIAGIDVLWSDEPPRSVCTDNSNGKHSPASVPFVPSVAGILIARYVADKICDGL